MSNSEFARSHLSDMLRTVLKCDTLTYKLYVYTFSGLMLRNTFDYVYVTLHCLKIRGLHSAESGAIHIKL